MMELSTLADVLAIDDQRVDEPPAEIAESADAVAMSDYDDED